ncbi:MAG: hypothetical protein ACRYGI_09615 [Janthinobacterium lividum]
MTDILTAHCRDHAHALQYRMAILNLLRSDPAARAFATPIQERLPLPQRELKVAE